MASFEDALKSGNVVTGLAIGVGMMLLAPMIKPLVRPVAKTVLRAGVAAYDQGKTALAEINEQAGDIVAEVRAEIEQESTAGNGAQRGPAGMQAQSGSTPS